MAAIRRVLIMLTLGLAMVAFAPLSGSAQSTSNPSSTGSGSSDIGNRGAAGQTPGTAGAAAQNGSNPQQGGANAPAGTDPTPTTNSAPNSTTVPGDSGQRNASSGAVTGAAGTSGAVDQQTIGTTGQNGAARSSGHTGLIALVVLAAIVIVGFVMAGSHRRTNVHHRIG